MIDGLNSKVIHKRTSSHSPFLILSIALTLSTETFSKVGSISRFHIIILIASPFLSLNPRFATYKGLQCYKLVFMNASRHVSYDLTANRDNLDTSERRTFFAATAPSNFHAHFS